jgi:carboxyl-terminal processing protease
VREEILTGVTQTGNIGYIDLSIFWEDTAHDFEKALIQIKESRAQGLIIDLRQNGGGLLDSAIDILSHFVPKDKALVTTKENNPKDNITLFSHGSPISFSLPVVILLDSHSASASEIVAGALQDYRQAIIVWETSYGKGSVQQPFPLEDGSELKITVARWFTPYDRGIDGKGITPDISVKMTLQDYEKWYDREFEEAKKVLVRWIENRDRDATIKEFSASGKILESSGSTLSGQILREKQQ